MDLATRQGDVLTVAIDPKTGRSKRWWRFVYSSGAWATGIGLVLFSVLVVAYENRYRTAVRHEIQTSLIAEQEVIASVAAQRLGSYIIDVTAKLRLMAGQASALGADQDAHQALERMARHDLDRNWAAAIYLVDLRFPETRRPARAFRFDDDVVDPATISDSTAQQTAQEYAEILSHLTEYGSDPQVSCRISRTVTLSNRRLGQVLTVPIRSEKGRLEGLVAALLPVTFETDQLQVSSAESGKALWIFTADSQLLGDRFGRTPDIAHVSRLAAFDRRETLRNDKWVITVSPVSHGAGHPWSMVAATPTLEFDNLVRARLGGPWTHELLVTLACGNFIGLCLLLTLRHWREQVAVFRIQAERDTLTDVYTRRFLDREAAMLCRRYRQMGVLMVDLNDFKQHNDTLGHPTGDHMLKEAAELLKHSLRGEDLVIRFGGDEFVCLLPLADEETIQAIKMRIRGALQDWNAANAQPGVMLSFAIGHAAGSSSDLDELIHEADKQMYADKAHFKHRTNQSINA
ncbi:MAG: GGDEF domain-containing protein [Planctomycetes bacterium]|nr:GGDEF domain-containing protein [Planctomycetota bacterium]